LINFLINNLYYFRYFRRENLKSLNNFDQRIYRLLGGSKKKLKSPRNLVLLFITFFKLASMLLRQILRLPHYIIQTINLRRSQCEQIKSCEAFAIASNRLGLDDNETIISQIEQITQAIGGSNVLNLFSGYSSKQKTIILYDPLLESRFWIRKKITKDEKLFIIDGAYIIFLSIGLVVSGLFFRGAKELIFLISYLKQSKVTKCEESPSFYVRIVEALTFVAYDSLINRLPKHSTTFLTSNSFFIELLRVYILQNESSGKIIELLHGVIADSTEIWFRRLLFFQDKAEEKKCLLIPLVPNLPKLGTLDKHLINNNIAINVYLNLSLYKQKKLHGSYKAYALHQLKQLNLNPEDKYLTLVIYGGAGLEGNYFLSFLFELEIKFCDMIIAYFKEKKLNIKIIYALHPQNKLPPPRVVNIFKKRGVQVLEHSVFTYFIADYCISNLSSCLFELNWLGAECFSPMIQADGFYSRDYLKLIHHPEINGIEALNNTFYNFLNAGLKNEVKSYIEKFNKRLRMTKGKNIN
jgi:hypothetical protein